MTDKPEVFVEVGSMAVKKAFDKKYIKTLPKVMKTTTKGAHRHDLRNRARTISVAMLPALY